MLGPLDSGDPMLQPSLANEKFGTVHDTYSYHDNAFLVYSTFTFWCCLFSFVLSFFSFSVVEIYTKSIS